VTTDKKVFGWGDAECGQIGRLIKTRIKNFSALKIESIGAKDAVDVFCGNYHSFYKSSKGSIYAWGLN
jgi:alpha-tubulin suppressor-like RCC1 family protein